MVEQFPHSISYPRGSKNQGYLTGVQVSPRPPNLHGDGSSRGRAQFLPERDAGLKVIAMDEPPFVRRDASSTLARLPSPFGAFMSLSRKGRSC